MTGAETLVEFGSIDTVAPPDPNGTTARFDFTVAETGTLDECRLDSGPWAVCTAPVDYTGLTGGGHTFAVRAIDAAGNVSAAASHTWTVESGRPSVNIGFPTVAGPTTTPDTQQAAALRPGTCAAPPPTTAAPWSPST